MNFTQLECFVSLANTLNFVKTAEQLGISQPAVSKQIKALESELKAELFNRSSRSVVITQLGEEFLHNAKELLKLYYSTKEQVLSFENRNQNLLRIGYADPNLTGLMSTLLKKMSVHTPSDSIYPEFIQDQTDANLGRLKNSRLDLILGMKDARFDDSEVIFRKLKENSFWCVLPKSHPLSGRYNSYDTDQMISTETLWPFRQILAIPPYLLKNFYSRGLRIIPVNEELDNIICRSANEAYALVEAGFGFAMLPDFLLKDSPNAIQVRWKESPHAPFGIYYRSHLNRNSNLRLFINTIISHFKET